MTNLPISMPDATNGARASAPRWRWRWQTRSPIVATTEVKVPDIGNYTNIPVIEVLVKAGDTVAKDQGLVTLESDKATMEVPSSVTGVVKEVKVKVGDEISEGVVVAVIEAEGAVKSTLPLAGEVGARSATGEGGAGRTPTPTPASSQSAPAIGSVDDRTAPKAAASSG